MFIVLWLYTGISILQRPSLVGTCGTASWVWENNLRWVDCPVWKIPGVHSLVGFYINIFLLCDIIHIYISSVCSVTYHCVYVGLISQFLLIDSSISHLVAFAVDLRISWYISFASLISLFVVLFWMVQFWWDYSYISYLSPLFSFENLQVDHL